MFRPVTYLKTTMLLVAVILLLYTIKNKLELSGFNYKYHRDVSAEGIIRRQIIEQALPKEHANGSTYKSEIYTTIAAASRSRKSTEVTKSSGSKLSVVYASLDQCEKPVYSPEYNALCYNPSNISNWRKATRQLHCLPNHHLIGIRKCGTTDVIKWFQYHQKNSTSLQVQGDNIPSTYKCPLEYFSKKAANPGMSKRTDLMRYSPGNIMFSSVRERNSTHIVIQTTIQFLAFLGQPGKSKYLLTLRNPTDRTISYLFHAHKMRWIHPKMRFSEFNSTFVHNVVYNLIEDLRQCLQDNGELACVYMYDSRDGNLKVVLQHGLYIVYLKELFKMIPREDVYINQLEEYSADQLGAAANMVSFFGKTLTISKEEIETSKKERNKGLKSDVLPKTLQILDEFFTPFNKRLATLLGDKKWRFSRGTS